MEKKMSSIIARIDLDDATFRGTGTHIEPTYINYIFGNNGVGKSTIANAIRNGAGITYSDKSSAEDYQTLVFDQRFINQNIQNFRNLPGVFTMTEENAEIQKQIDAASGQQDTARKTAGTAAAEKTKLRADREEVTNRFHKSLWKNTESLRSEHFPLTQKGFGGSKKKFAEELLKHSDAKHDLAELQRMYQAAYSDTARAYPRFTDIKDISALDNTDGREILSVAIVNSSETDLAQFWREIGAEEWVQKGYTEYHKEAGGVCPYCNQILPPDFEKKLTDSFDDRYEKNKEQLDAFLKKYREQANTLFVPLAKPPEDLYPAVDRKTYDDKLAALKGIIAENVEKIREKVDEPARQVTLTATAPVLQELSDIIAGFNKLIDENNKIVADGPAKRLECRTKVFEYMAFEYKDLIDAYRKSCSELDNKIAAQQKIIDTQNETIRQMKEKIRQLDRQTKETESAMHSINATLKDAGFQGFELCPHWEDVKQKDGTVKRVVPFPVRNYAVVRVNPETGAKEIAENLSEGEKNFIAFLYFQQQVFGTNGSENNDGRRKIVVIDDPVSSMDSGTMFIVGAQVRKMIEICRNSVDSSRAVVPGNFIKQIFILTHNAYFHKDVTYLYANKWDFVSFYLIRKIDNKSSVRLYDDVNPDCPTARMNINPVKNSYAALWESYKEVKSGIPLKSIIRRILEYYFLQLCGYDGEDLRQCILVDHKADFMRDANGEENDERYGLVKVLLSYITSDSIGINDGIHYTDEFLDEKVYRDTFEMIFRCMGQSQHFDMMMGNSYCACYGKR